MAERDWADKRAREFLLSMVDWRLGPDEDAASVFASELRRVRAEALEAAAKECHLAWEGPKVTPGTKLALAVVAGRIRELEPKR